MTASLTRPPLTDSHSHGRRRRGSGSLLRLIMRADATGCGGAGLLIAFAATLGCAGLQYLGVRRLA